MSFIYADIYREQKKEGVCAGFLLLTKMRKIGIDYGMLFNGGSWWSHQMETFPAIVAFCEGNSPVTDEFLLPKPVTLYFLWFAPGQTVQQIIETPLICDAIAIIIKSL